MLDTEPAGHAYPATHDPLHELLFIAAVDPYRPGLHSVHSPAPPRLYVPAGHSTVVAFRDPAGQAYPMLQFPEHVATVIPVTNPYVPGSHGPLQLEVVRPAVAP